MCCCSNLFHALERCRAPFAGDGEAAAAARNEFIDQRLLPACNAAGAQGWCVMPFLDKMALCATGG